MIIRSAANLPDRVRVSFGDDPGRARQSMRDECDINKIMAKYQKTGAIDHFSRHAPQYDFADSIEFHDAMNIVTEGNRMFADLPSSLRSRFENPGEFLDFVQDEGNAEEMVELGLRAPRTASETRRDAAKAESPPGGEAPVAPSSEAPAEAAPVVS